MTRTVTSSIDGDLEVGVKTIQVLVLLLVLLAACGPQAAPAVEPSPTPALAASPTVPPAATEGVATATPPPAEPAAQQVPALPVERGDLFSTSGVCSACHTQMIDTSGVNVSNDLLWSPTMMANAARDPYWQASVRSETLSHPEYQAVIEDKCATCHMPMARFTAAWEGGQGLVLDDGFLTPVHTLRMLALDGVSCTLCHQIARTELGQPESFSGKFSIDTERPPGERLAYGPYAVGQNLRQMMQTVSGFVPVQSPHVHRSQLCATCHTLYTPTVDVGGEIVGDFPEQVPYLEWAYSGYRHTRACQDCHMPLAEGSVRLSTTGGPPRSPFYQHIFVGGNAYMLGVLRTYGEELGVFALEEHFDAKIADTLDQLQQRTAVLTLEGATLSRGQLVADVLVESLVGHKFPTGFPSRRVWIHLAVQDAGGVVVFESGAVAADGSIVGNDNDAAPDRFEPHYATITRADEVQIYEAIMSDTQGRVTTTLLSGAGYFKDNRLLPGGFQKQVRYAAVAVQGAAAEDDDFVGGSDRVHYVIDLGSASGPFALTVELLYQSVGYRWVQKLQSHAASEPARFLRYYDAVSNQPVRIASTTVELGP
jgi:mono/diheme cytochrome c family protein